MRASRPLVTALLPLVSVLLLDACSTAGRNAIEAPAPDSTGAFTIPRPPSYFASPRLIGVEPEFDRAEADEWVVGNELLYGISLFGPEGLRRWLLRVSVLSAPEEYEDGRDAPFQQTVTTILGEYRFESRALSLEVATYDGAGVTEQTGVYRVPADFLGYGLFPGMALATRGKREIELPKTGKITLPTLEEREILVRSLAAWIGLFSFAQANPALKPIMDTVIAKPSILEVIRRGFRIDVTANADFSRSRRVAPFPGLSGDVLSMPFEVKVYDSPALVGTVLIARSRPPIMPGAGIVAAEAWHPADRSRVVSIRLLSATLPRQSDDASPTAPRQPERVR